MPEIILVCVSDDLPQAEALAEMFDGAGFSVRDDVFNDTALARATAGVLVLSPAAFACGRFRDAAQRVHEAAKAVIACLEPGRRLPFADAPVFDLSGWCGEAEDPMLEPLFFAVDRMRAGTRLRPHRWTAAPQDETFDPREGFVPRVADAPHAQL
jgi:hypothetical protein